LSNPFEHDKNSTWNNEIVTTHGITQHWQESSFSILRGLLIVAKLFTQGSFELFSVYSFCFQASAALNTSSVKLFTASARITLFFNFVMGQRFVTDSIRPAIQGFGN